MALPAQLLGKLRIPVVGAPLFIVSNPDLVIEQCKAGIIGSFPALNARPAPVLEDWLKRITSELAEYQDRHPHAIVAPFAVNQPARDRWVQLMDRAFSEANLPAEAETTLRRFFESTATFMMNRA